MVRKTWIKVKSPEAHNLFNCPLNVILIKQILDRLTPKVVEFPKSFRKLKENGEFAFEF
jgi:hypothetical protein